MASSTQFFKRLKRKYSTEVKSSKKSTSREVPDPENVAPFFGDPRDEKPTWENKSKTRKAKNARDKGEQILLTFIRTRLGDRAENLAVRLMNKTPLKDGSEFTYTINQSTEESDLKIISRDLLGGRLYRSGTKFYGGAWCRLLLGDRFATSPSSTQIHELVYTRSSCTCLTCIVKGKREQMGENRNSFEAGSAVSGRSTYIPENSAMANFVQFHKMPKLDDLLVISDSVEQRELDMGTVVRLNSRASSKFKFTSDFKTLFGHLAYTGPITHEEVYRKVTTVGVNYYLYNKGKKERKVYLRGFLHKIPLELGIVKLGARPLRTDELGCHYLLYRKQTIQVYVGEVALEGNTIGSFIQTGLKFYVGFGEEDGCSALYPNRKLGKPRSLGVNELLLHHHMINDCTIRAR